MGTRERSEERERQLAAVSRLRHRAIRRPRRKTLRAILRGDVPLGESISLEELRSLVRREFDRPVVSLYLSLSEARTTRDPEIAVSVFHSLRHDAMKAEDGYVPTLTDDQLRQLEADLAEIEAVLQDEVWGRRGARGLAILKSGEELNRLVGLPLPFADRLVIDPDPYITPLQRVLEEHPKVLVVEIEKDTARLWTYHLGHRRQLARERDFVPSDTVDASRPGKVQRHRQTHLHWHLRRAARLAEARFASEECDLLAVAGEERVRSLFTETLPTALAARLLPALPPGDANRLAMDLEQELVRRKASEEEAAVGDLGLYAARGRLAAGLEEVIEVTNDFLVQRLLITESAGRGGFVCRHHHVLALEPGACPFCGRDMLPVTDVADELAELAYLRGLDHIVMRERPELLGPYDGAAAVLYSPATVEDGEPVTAGRGRSVGSPSRG